MAQITTLSAAVKAAVHDGDVVALEGFTHLIPHAAGHEIIRQGRKHLTLIRMTPDLIYDQMIGMGCVDKLVFSSTCATYGDPVETPMRESHPRRPINP